MTTDPIELRKMAEAHHDTNLRFRTFLKHQSNLSSAEVDNLAHGIEKKVWQRIDCTACANCCREVSPTFNETDVERLAGHLGLSKSAFTENYLEPTESPEPAPWVMRDKPCPFLKENRCSVYEHRPDNCREYPYLHQPDLIFRTFAMIERLSTCPAVFEFWEELKQATGFRR